MSLSSPWARRRGSRWNDVIVSCRSSECAAAISRMRRLGLLGVLLPLTRTRLPGVRKTVRLLAELLGDLEFWEGEAAALP